jgi:hypothetical protein
LLIGPAPLIWAQTSDGPGGAPPEGGVQTVREPVREPDTGPARPEPERPDTGPGTPDTPDRPGGRSPNDLGPLVADPGPALDRAVEERPRPDVTDEAAKRAPSAEEGAQAVDGRPSEAANRRLTPKRVDGTDAAAPRAGREREAAPRRDAEATARRIGETEFAGRERAMGLVDAELAEGDARSAQIQRAAARLSGVARTRAEAGLRRVNEARAELAKSISRARLVNGARWEGSRAEVVERYEEYVAAVEEARGAAGVVEEAAR